MATNDDAAAQEITRTWNRAAKVEYYEGLLATVPTKPSLVLFESMMGSQYSDSPRAIYEEMLRQRVDATMVWSVHKDARPFPPGLLTVTRQSREWYEALATARVWVDNQGFPAALRKPSATYYVQTWHGTPLKLMGWNNRALAEADVRERERAQKSVDRWDAVPAPSDYFVETIVDAYRSHADVLRIGSPRNDSLLRPLTGDAKSARLHDLGVRDDMTTILYAPTRTGTADTPDAVAAVAVALAATGAQVLYRAHYSDARTSSDATAGQVRDVSHVGDMADLLSVADILVTDYSSSMFDFCLTDRPIILFQPDQSAYLSARGAYFDITEFPPGPIATTTDVLTALVRDADSHSGEWLERRAQYRSKFGQYETGHAAELLVRDHIAPRLARGHEPGSDIAD
jgi:CDP-glycerol glycerophosphotransferase